jgi:hypothetical protein
MWRLQYSPTKTKCIIFGETPREIRRRPSWHFGDQTLDIVSSYTYLGVILSSDLSSQLRTETMCNKGYSNLGLLKGLGFHSNGLSPITCGVVWHRMLVPSILYGCEVWGNIRKREMKQLESVQYRVGRHIQGNRNNEEKNNSYSLNVVYISLH